jgi:hypothetical protein
MIRQRYAAGIALTVILTANLFTTVEPAHSAQAQQQMYAVCIADWFCGTNYEFKTPSYYSSNVDWMWNYMWWGNADVVKAKQPLQSWGYSGTGSTKYLGMYNGSQSSWQWDHDNGVKNDSIYMCNNNHYYMFAPSGADRSGYIPGWGWIVYGSSHVDKNEGAPFYRPWCTENDIFGWSEESESDLVWMETNLFGHWTHQNYFGVGNAQYGLDTLESNHYWQSNGSVSISNIP